MNSEWDEENEELADAYDGELEVVSEFQAFPTQSVEPAPEPTTPTSSFSLSSVSPIMLVLLIGGGIVLLGLPCVLAVFLWLYNAKPESIADSNQPSPQIVSDTDSQQDPRRLPITSSSEQPYERLQPTAPATDSDNVNPMPPRPPQHRSVPKSQPTAASTNPKPNARSSSKPKFDPKIGPLMRGWPSVDLLGNEDWPKIYEKAYRRGGPLLIAIVDGDDGSRKVLVRNISSPDVVLEKQLAVGRGIPLLARTPEQMAGKSWGDEGLDPIHHGGLSVVSKREEDELFTIVHLTDFGNGGSIPLKGNRIIFRHRHLWSPDGRFLYVLSHQHEKYAIWKLDTVSWRVVASRSTSDTIRDIAYTSEGLLVSTSNKIPYGLPEYDEKWMQFVPNKVFKNMDGFYLLNPDDLKLTRAWFAPRAVQVTGHPTSDLVYFRDVDHSVSVFNVKSGELLNSYSGRELIRDPWQEQASFQLGFGNLRLLSDGRQLISHGIRIIRKPAEIIGHPPVSTLSGPRYVNRFDVDGSSIRWSESVPVGGIRTQQSRSADVGVSDDFVCLPGWRFQFAGISDLTKTVASLTLPPDAAVAMDSPSHTAFISWPDWSNETLQFRMIRGDVDITRTLSTRIKQYENGRGIAYPGVIGEEMRELTLTPFEMSASPDGRSAIVFAFGGAHFVQTKLTPAGAWAFQRTPEQLKAYLAQRPEEIAASNTDEGGMRVGTVATIGLAQQGARSMAAVPHLYNPYRGLMGSAVCIDPSGLFVTTASNVEGVPDHGLIDLVLHAGSIHQRKLEVAISRIDADKNLALLKANAEEATAAHLVALSSISTAVEIGDAVTVWGYNTVEELELDSNRYPSISWHSISVNRRSESGGQLKSILHSGTLPNGNAGGAIVAEGGNLVGIALTGFPEGESSAFIPAEVMLQTGWPEIHVLAEPETAAYKTPLASNRLAKIQP